MVPTARYATATPMSEVQPARPSAVLLVGLSLLLGSASLRAQDLEGLVATHLARAEGVAVPQLVARGFRESDVAALQNYLAAHDLKAETSARTRPIAISFSKVVKKYDKIKRPVGKDQVLAFLYQREKVEVEARRAWAEGLIRSLDDQRVRILQSCFSEIQSTGFWAPDDVEAGVANMLAVMRLPDYEQRASAEAAGATP